MQYAASPCTQTAAAQPAAAAIGNGRGAVPIGTPPGASAFESLAMMASGSGRKEKTQREKSRS